MPEFVNTHEQNDNVLITTVSLCELSFTSGAGSSCLRQKGSARLLHKVLQVLHHILTPGVVILPRFVIQNNSAFFLLLFFFPSNHMTPIKLREEKRNRRKDVPQLKRGQNVFKPLLWARKINPISTNVQRVWVHAGSLLTVVKKNAVQSQHWAFCCTNSRTYWDKQSADALTHAFAKQKFTENQVSLP